MAEWLMHMPHVRKVENSNLKSWPSPTHRCIRFATASTCMRIAVLPWHYDAEMSTANSLHASSA